MRKVDPAFVVPPGRFDSDDFVEWRIREVPQAAQGAMRTTLRYLYFTDGPKNLPASRKKLAEPFLEDFEKVLVRWLQPRTNGQYRRSYGQPALRCARAARYRCQECGYADVRVLEFDHVEGRVANCRFACLCANCHKIKSRLHDWTGKRRESASQSGGHEQPGR